MALHVQRRPVVAFFVLAFALSWAGSFASLAASEGLLSEENLALAVLGVLAAVGPAVAAGVIARAAWGGRAVDELFRSVFRGVRLWRWWLLVLGAQAVISVLALALSGTVDVAAKDLSVDWVALPVLTLGGAAAFTLWEEMGFRGFAQRELQHRHGALAAAGVVGAIWSLWHLPLFFLEGNPASELPPVLFVAEILAAAVIYGWIFNSTGGSLLFVTVFHASGNAVGQLVVDSPVDPGSYMAFKVAIFSAIALALVAAFGARELSRRGRRPASLAASPPASLNDRGTR